MLIIFTSLQTDNHASTSSLTFFIAWMLFLMPNQQCQITEGNDRLSVLYITCSYAFQLP